MNTDNGLKPGFILHNIFRIERMLGQGGFGITYLAYDIALERYVAIKEFFPKDYCDRDDTTSHVTVGTKNTKEFVERLKGKFLKEARNIAKIDHPSIIKIHTAFEENQTAYYVMDFIEGRNLSTIVKEDGPLPYDDAVRYIKSIGKALEYVHSHRMNHFDVKPANIIIRESDKMPILIDFGLSKHYDANGNQTSTTPIGMSHGFAPMEQYTIGGIQEFSPQTDLYALAATLYYILSGIVPPQATILIDQELTYPPSIPLVLIKPISKAMSSSRRKRHESIGAFLNELPSDLNEARIESTISDTNQGYDGSEDTLLPNDEEEIIPVEKKSYKGIWVTSILVLFIVAGIYWIFVGSTNIKNNRPTTVIDLGWESPLGLANYSGEVVVDSITNTYIPNGYGIARIISGPYEGNVYEGSFIDGIMEGETTYTLQNGDEFKGTFKANTYEKGRYTIKEDSSYFEGTFENMEPKEGIWRDRYNHELD